MKMKNQSGIKNIGYLMHFTHYDPLWISQKKKEKPFDMAVGREIVDALAKQGFNTLAIDIEDGVQLPSFPELRRHYSVPLAYLKDIISRARSNGMEIIPKMNFSQSPKNQHNHWFSPYNKLNDSERYWKKAFDIIDEIIGICRPERFFHIGMDEDTQRTPAQYIKAVNILHKGLKARGLRTIMWNDSTHIGKAMYTCVEKVYAAEQVISKDIAQVIWDYIGAQPAGAERLKKNGFEVWGAP